MSNSHIKLPVKLAIMYLKYNKIDCLTCITGTFRLLVACPQDPFRSTLRGILRYSTAQTVLATGLSWVLALVVKNRTRVKVK